MPLLTTAVLLCVTRTKQARQVAPRATTRGTHTTSITQNIPTHPRDVSTRSGHSLTLTHTHAVFLCDAAVHNCLLSTARS